MAPLRPSTPVKRPDRTRRRTLMRWVKRIGLGLIAAVIAAGLVYAWMPKPVAVDLAIASRTALDVEVTEDGQTRVRDRFVVASPITGELRRIELEPGAAVVAGDVVAVIEPAQPMLLDTRSRREATARVTVALAHQRAVASMIARATTARDAAVREAERARLLQKRGAITQSELERAELTEQLAIRDLAAAELQHTAARAEVDAARALLDEPRGDRSSRSVAVTAPATGQVLRVIRDSAGPVAAGAPLLEVGDPHALELVVDVLSSDAAGIQPQMVVSIERWGGDRPLTGRVRLVEPSAFTRVSALGIEEQRVRVIASIDAPPPALGDGFRVTARIITWHADRVLTIPLSTVFRDHGRWAVYVEAGGRARLQPVTLGHRGPLDVEILGGLVEGDRVIMHPGDDIKPDVRVTERR